MMRNAAHADLRILRINTAKHDERLRMLGNHGPGILCAPGEFKEVLSQYMRDNRLRRCGTIAGE